MPPRITRNSYRPRASDRTMVDTLNHRSLVALANSTVPLTHQRTLIRMGTSQTSLAKPNYRGLDLEKISRVRSRQKFFLDIPPQKQTQDCAATVIWRPSLAAFF